MKEMKLEYAIIEEDLANLKRLQQENDQLKAELNNLRKNAPAAIASEIIPEAVEEEEDLEAMMAQAIADSKPAGSQKAAPQVMDLAKNEDPVEEVEQKSAEELLSEFEKMLG